MEQERDNRSSEAKSAGLVVIGQVLAGLLAIALLMVLTRLLDTRTFGLFAMIYALYEVLVAGGTVGLPASMLYFAPRATETDCRRLGFGTGVALLLCALPIAGALTLSSFLSGHVSGLTDNPKVFALLPYLAAFILFDFPSQMLSNYLLGRQRYNASVLTTLLLVAILFVGLVVPTALGASLDGLMLCFVGAGAARFMAFVVYFLAIERRGTLRPDLPTLRGQLRFGLPLFFDNLVGKLNRYLDRLFIGIVFSAEVFAVYHIAAQELPLVGMLPYSLTSAILPRLVLLYREEQYTEFVELWHTSMAKMAVIMLPIAVFFFVLAGDFLTVAFTEGYAGGKLVFRLYLFLLPLRLCSYGGVVQSTGATKYVLYATLASLTVNMALNWPLLKLLGMPGPAAASVLAQVVAVLCMLGAIRAKVNLSWVRVFPFAAVARAGAVAVVAGLPMVLLDLGGLSPGQRLAAAAAIYLPCYLTAGLLTRTITRVDLRYLIDLARPGRKNDRGSNGAGRNR